MGWSNDTKWGRKKTRNRGAVTWIGGRKKTRNRGAVTVTWIDKSGAKPAPFVQDLPRYVDAPAITDELIQSLVPGTMFVSLAILGIRSDAPGKTNNRKFQTLERWWHIETGIVQIGQLMIYSGVVRVDERESNGRIVSVPRHTFIFGSCRYIINDFSLIKIV